MRWTEQLRNIWRPPEKLRPSEWAERNRRLPIGQSAETGPWWNEAAPYLAGIMDLCAAPGIQQINIIKAAQIGVSEALRNVLGYWAQREPDPVGLTLPDMVKGRKIVNNRVLPMFHETPGLRALMTERAADAQALQIKLVNGFLLHLMWSGSASAMSSDPMRRVINDEVEKFEEWTGREADPVALTFKRLRTYGDRKLQVNISTPTTRLGKIWRLFEGSLIHLFFFIPCPHCGRRQRLLFAGLKFDGRRAGEEKKQHAARLREEEAVWYNCAACGGRIEEGQKEALVKQGRWGSGDWNSAFEDGEIIDAVAVKQWTPGTTIGMHISALTCLWESWGNIAAEWVRAEGDLSRTFDFRVQTLGEPFEQIVERTSIDDFARKCEAGAAEEGFVPVWCAKLIAAIDTQHDHFWAVLRAWGAGMISRRVWHGRLESFAELDDMFLKRQWPIETLPGQELQTRPVDLVLIDSGGTRLTGEAISRTAQVYAWALPRQGRVFALKGMDKEKAGQHIYWSYVDVAPQRERRSKIQKIREQRQKIKLCHVDVNHFQDELSYLIARREGEEEVWQLNRRNDEEYNRHMVNLIKVLVRQGKHTAEIWKPAQSGARVDLRDCEGYQAAGAHLCRVPFLPRADVPPPTSSAPTPKPRPTRERGGFLDDLPSLR